MCTAHSSRHPGGGVLHQASPRTSTAAGGTHPTGMHFCSITFQPNQTENLHRKNIFRVLVTAPDRCC